MNAKIGLGLIATFAVLAGTKYSNRVNYSSFFFFFLKCVYYKTYAMGYNKNLNNSSDITDIFQW